MCTNIIHSRIYLPFDYAPPWYCTHERTHTCTWYAYARKTAIGRPWWTVETNKYSYRIVRMNTRETVVKTRVHLWPKFGSKKRRRFIKTFPSVPLHSRRIVGGASYAARKVPTAHCFVESAFLTLEFQTSFGS